MTVQLFGAARLAALMRSERLRDLDSSWLLHGPEEMEEEAEDEVFEPLKFAAE